MTKPRIALITGAAVRIGRCIAETLAAEGWSIALHYNQSQESAKLLADEISAIGNEVKIYRANLEIESEVVSLIADINQSMGPVDCLVNNASAFEYDTITSSNRALWDCHMETNLRAPFVLSQQFAGQKSCKHDRCIINILDQRVWNLTPHFMTYTLSKASLWTLTQTLALALAPSIRVNAIGPGPVLPSTRQTDDDFKKQCKSTLLEHGVSPHEIANTVSYILETTSLTGQMIAIDSGQHLGWSLPNSIHTNE